MELRNCVKAVLAADRVAEPAAAVLVYAVAHTFWRTRIAHRYP